MLAVGERLARRGHVFIFAGAPCLRSRVEQLGFQFEPIDIKNDCVDQLMRSCMSVANARNFFLAISRPTVRHLPSILAKHCASALLCDEEAFGAPSAAISSSIPHFVLSAFSPLFPDPMRPPPIVQWKSARTAISRTVVSLSWSFASVFFGLPIVHAINEELGSRKSPLLKSLTQEVTSAAAYITQIPWNLDFDWFNAPGNLVYAGPLICETKLQNLSACHMPQREVLDAAKASGIDIVYVSLGTVQTWSHLSLLRRIASACTLTISNVHCFIGLGGAVSEEEMYKQLRSSAVNTRRLTCMRWAPQKEIIDEYASLTVCHGGLSTILESLRSGVPCVAVPLSHDQPGQAARLKLRGAGEVVKPQLATTGRISKKVRRVLESKAHKNAAVKIQGEIEKCIGADGVAELVERIAKRQK